MKGRCQLQQIIGEGARRQASPLQTGPGEAGVSPGMVARPGDGRVGVSVQGRQLDDVTDSGRDGRVDRDDVQLVLVEGVCWLQCGRPSSSPTLPTHSVFQPSTRSCCRAS